jgi:two-component SAPR family response regulator
MPLILGTEWAEAIRKDNPDGKIILISAFADEELNQFSANFRAFLLSKPFSPDRLLGEIDKVLGQNP